MNKLVSIVTPCFNGGNNLFRLLDSILNQTYLEIEFILIDDGSTDNTAEVVSSYKEKFLKKNINLIYIYQENKGQANAINTGLKIIKGSYFCWPDSDDYLEPNSIEKRINFLENNKEFGVVTSDAYVRNIRKLNSFFLASKNNLDKFNENQFDLLLSGNSMFLPGTHMVRMSSFYESHPSGQIVDCRGGQNWQILLPIYFLHKRHFLNEPLYNYIVYDISHSRGDYTLEKCISRSYEHENIIIKTIDNMNINSDIKNKYFFETKIRYTRKRLTLAFQFRDKILLNKMYEILKIEQQPRLKEFIYKILVSNYILYIFFKFFIAIFHYVLRFFNLLVYV